MLIAYLIFALCAFLLLVALTFYFSPGAPKGTGISGPDPSDEKDGNLGDIAQSGSLQTYLEELHEEYGPLASFWWGKQNIVSICSARLFNEHSKFFDRPVALFEFLEPLFTEDSLWYANGTEGKVLREKYDVELTADKCNDHIQSTVKLAEAMTDKWSKEFGGPGDHFPVHGHMLAFAMRSVAASIFGEVSEEFCTDFCSEFSLAIDGLMALWIGQSFPDGDPRQARFQDSLEKLQTIVTDVVQSRIDKYQKKVGSDGDSIDSRKVMLDRIIESSKKLDDDGDEFEVGIIEADAMTYLVKGFYPLASLLTWCLYYLARNQEVQDRLREEFVVVLGRDTKLMAMTPQNYSKMTYCRAVIDETLRCGKIVPIAARCSEMEHNLGGHVIPPYTPVIHALGVSLGDANNFPQPERFDPDRFLSEARTEMPAFAFSPFGFSGKRKCPGFRLAYVQAMVLLTVFIRRFKVKLVDDALEAVPQFDFVTKPRDEVHVFLEAI